MKKFLVKDLMVPISEYATVKVGASLIDAIHALEKAQEAFTESKYQHRAILVLDKSGNVVGKVGQFRALKAIEPEFHQNAEIEKMRRFNFSEEYLVRLRDKYKSQGEIIKKETLREAARKKVEDFMQAPSAGEYVAEDSSLDTAMHKLVSGAHLSLLVTRSDEIVGILRISDVFAAVFHEMKELEILNN